MKNSAKLLKRNELAVDMQNLGNHNYSLFESKVVVKNQMNKMCSDDYKKSMELLENAFETLYMFAGASNVKDNLMHYYKEVKKFLEHTHRKMEFEECCDYSEYNELVDELAILPPEAYNNDFYTFV